ncbi:MAG: hypothetical protein Q7P63_04055 [Verrucomicrobiota bacterium JB022]|nr:hypothetical protein [Verrucomicrobiota bacterium JB022]
MRAAAFTLLFSCAHLAVGWDQIPRLYDADDDGLLDEWEIRYFGDLTSTNGIGDFDKDGTSDRQEARYGLDPTDGVIYIKASLEWHDESIYIFPEPYTAGARYHCYYTYDFVSWHYIYLSTQPWTDPVHPRKGADLNDEWTAIDWDRPVYFAISIALEPSAPYFLPPDPPESGPTTPPPSMTPPENPLP